MTTTELLIFSDADIVKLLLAHWKLPSLDAIEFTGFYKPNYKGGLGTLEDLCLVAPTDQPEPFPYSMPFGHEFRPVFHPAAVDIDLQPMQTGQAYRFSVRLSKPTKTPRTDPFALISKNVRPCNEPEHQRRVEELLRIGSSGPKKTQRQLAAALEQMGSSMYLEPNRFLFELLQNADDYPDPRFGNEVRVNLRLLNDYILFQHNGLPFLYRNVESLADVGNSTKINERETTGYKGIGFKSVFGVSKWVYLRSNKYTFCFADEGNSAEPWHTWPRWTAKLPSDLANDPHFSDERRYAVSFALRIDSSRVSGSAGYATVLQSLLARPQFALFLRHLSELAIEGVDIPSTRLRRTLDQHTKRTIFQVGDQKNEYSVTSYDIDARSKLDELIKAGVAAEKSFPEKLRDAHTVKIWFAARFNQEGGLESLPASEAPLFSYLPTNDTSYGLPLLVNADFILAPNRVQVQSHHLWNAFLFHQIGLHLIQWIADQVKADETHARNIYPFIPAQQSANPNQEALNAGIQEGINSIRCLPSADSKELKLVSEAVLDEPGLYSLLPTLYHGLLNDGLTVVGANAKASVEAADLIGRFNLHIIDWDKFKKIFAHSDITKFYQPADAARLLQRFASDKTIVTAEWKSICWLFDQHGELVAPNEKALYGELSEKWDLDFPLAAEVRYLHPELQQLLRANPDFATWVKDGLAIAPYSRAQIIRDRLIPAASNSAIDSAVRAQCIQYLYHLHRRQELQKWLTEIEQTKLSKMYVLCDDGKYHHVDTCYLSHHYNPPFELEVIAEEIGKAQFPLVSKDYLQIYPEPQGWHEFWSYCNIPTPNAADLLKTKLLPVGVQVSTWTSAKHEAVLRLAIDAFTKGQTFPHTELGKLKARTVSGTAALAECVLPLAYNPHLALLAKLPISPIPANTLAADYFTSADPGAVANFFQAGGCKPWDESITLTYATQQMLASPLEFEASIAAVRQLYEWDQNKKLTVTHKELLKTLPLYQKDGSVRPANLSFFSSFYEPEHDVEKLTGGQQQQVLSPEYVPTQVSPPDLKVWSKFFDGLGVVGKFTVKFHEKISYAQALDLYPNYVKWVDDNPEICPPPYSGFKQQHSFQYLYLINNPELVSNTLIAELIAPLFGAVEQNIKQKPPSVYHTTANGKTWPAGSLLCGFPVIPCTGTPDMRPAHEVYSKHLSAVPAGFPVAKVSYGSLELEQRLGLRTHLTPEGSLKVLIQALPKEAIAGANVTSTARNEFILRLFELQTALIGLQKPRTEWGQQLLLPAANNTWLTVANSYIISNEEYINPNSGVVLKLLPTLKQDLFQQLCVTLGATLIDNKDFVDEEAPLQSKDFSNDFRARITRCKVLELIAYLSGETLEQAKAWSEKLAGLRFLQVPSLRRKSLTIPDYTVLTNDNNSFADGTFLFVGSLFRGHWARLATFLIRELQLPRSVRVFLVANLLESRELGEQIEVLVAQKLEVPSWLLPTVAPKQVAISDNTANATIVAPKPVVAPDVDLAVPDNSFDDEHDFSQETTDEDQDGDILDSSLSPEEQKIFHEQACKAAVEWLQAHDYILPVHIEELFSVLKPVVAPDGKTTIKVVVRSALKGRLFFHVHEWAELCEPDTLLLLFCRHTGTKPFIQAVPNPAEQLVLDNPNTYIRVPNSPLNAAVLHSLATDTYKHSPEFRYIFLHLPGPGAPPINLAHRRVEEVLTADTSFAI